MPRWSRWGCPAATALSLAAITVVLAASTSWAIVDVTIAIRDKRATSIFANDMILQRDKIVPIWGRADPGEDVAVEIASQLKQTTADLAGEWRVELDPVPAGGPYEMVITGDNTLVFTNVMFGDVWLMAGQSNLMIRRPWKNEIARSPDARVFKRTWGDRPGGMPFNFAREMSEELGVPVGVLQRAMRGSSGLLRTWLGHEAGNTSTDPVVLEVVESGNFGQTYDLVIGDIAGFAIKGIVWWQGESDTRSRNDPGEFYGHVFPAMIESWRAAWGETLPFLFLQEPVGGGMQAEQLEPAPLPDPNDGRKIQAARVRLAFMKALELEQTQVITSSDLVDGLHPKDREGYLRRIMTTVLGFVYGYDGIYSGPTFQGMSIEDGNRVRIRFRPDTATGLHSRGGPVLGFAISGDGETFVWADAEIQGEEVVVWSDAVPTPTIVRYGHHREYDYANLFNEAGMGTPTFATDITPFE